jgi:hypothetical protein
MRSDTQIDIRLSLNLLLEYVLSNQVVEEIPIDGDKTLQ